MDDLARWRVQTLPTLADAPDISRRVSQARSDFQLIRDRVRSLPVPAEALRPLADYTTALAHVDRALQALDAYATSRTPTSLQSADAELAAYRAARQSPLTALTQLGH